MKSNIKEVQQLGEHTRYECVKAHSSDQREWLAEAPIASSLQQYQMEHVGVMDARPPYRIVRANQSGAFFLVTISGTGKILVNGQWHICKPGEACILPAYNTNALTLNQSQNWKFCWVRYHHEGNQVPLIHATQAIVADFPSDSFHAAVQGLLAESKTPERLPIVQQWTQLIHIYVSEFLKSHQLDDRLWKLWFHIEKNIHLEWNLSSMSQVANLSDEHIRRLCKSQYGRSPIQQLRWLRMHRAAELLLGTDDKIETIARDLGYNNPIVFSSAFRKQFGIQPSKYRKQTTIP